MDQSPSMFCYCHWGGEKLIAEDGTITYRGGTTEAIYVKSTMSYKEVKKVVLDRLNIEPLGTTLYFTVKFDLKQLIPLKDQESVNMLLNLNEEYVHIYVSSNDEEAEASPQIIATRQPNASNVQALELQGVDIENPPDAFANLSGDITHNSSSLWNNLIIGVGQAFEDPKMFRSAIFKFSLAHKFPYRYSHNKCKYIRAYCTIEGCPWNISARSDGELPILSIRKFSNIHSHSVGDLLSFKPKFDSNLMGDIFTEKLASNYHYLPRQMCKDSRNELNIEMTYHQAWSAKEKGKQILNGNVDDSYKLIPWYCTRLKEIMPGSFATWECYEDGKFRQLFVSYGYSISGFHAGCRPLVFIDGCHLSGPYEGTLLSACSIDANNGVYPLAYGVVTSENEEDWYWFLKHLKDIIQDREVVVISDRNPSIVKGIDELFGTENHAHCFRHLQENFSSFINKNPYFKMQSAAKKRALQYLVEVAYARSQANYDKAMQKMLGFQPYLHQWILHNGPEHWPNAIFRKQRWDWLNSNIAESFNSWMKEARVLPIGKLMEAHCSKYSQLLLNKVNDIRSWKIPVGKRIEEKLKENLFRGQGMDAVHRPPFEVEVYERRKGNHVVNLEHLRCTCLEWQMNGLPCPHACRAISLLNGNVYEFVHDWYKKEKQETIYSYLMHGVPTFDKPDINMLPIAYRSDDSIRDSQTVALLPPKTKRPPGRPRKKRIESQFIAVRPLRCSRCEMVGHNSRVCKEPI